ncbi:MAG TPA: 2-dehydropantoate 2-reductase [Ramlibacter sp.]|nr:2-dehydropantoate 2-reductase [Ramlibacter sp.]
MNASPRILVYGAGAVGAWLGASLADATDVTLLARGAHAAAMKSAGGITLVTDGQDRLVPVRVVTPDELVGRYDIVLVTLKATQLAAAVSQMSGCVAEGGALVMVQNGLPWWYFGDATPLRTLDPDGSLGRGLDMKQVVGAVIYRPCEMLAPGRVRAEAFPAGRLVVGEPEGEPSSRCHAIAQAITREHFRVEVTGDIRRAKWEKLLVNLLWNPLAALTQSAPAHMGAHGPLKDVLVALLRESVAVAASTGVELAADLEAQLKRTAVNYSPPSMLQDVRAGRAMELDAIVNCVIEIADLRGVPVPTLKTVAACASMLDERIRADRIGVVPVQIG